MSRVWLLPAWGPSTGPTACALAGRRCSLWGWRKGVLGGGAFHHCEGRQRSGAVPPPTARPLGGLLGSATYVLWARVCGCGGPTLSPWPACPVGAACRGGVGGPSPGGVACHRCEGRLVSGAVPPPAAHPLERCNGSSDSTQFIHQCDQNFNDSQMYISAVNVPLVFMFSVRRQMSPVSGRRVACVFRDFPIRFT